MARGGREGGVLTVLSLLVIIYKPRSKSDDSEWDSYMCCFGDVPVGSYVPHTHLKYHLYTQNITLSLPIQFIYKTYTIHHMLHT